jgi:hypothetical protein
MNASGFTRTWTGTPYQRQERLYWWIICHVVLGVHRIAWCWMLRYVCGGGHGQHATTRSLAAMIQTRTSTGGGYKEGRNYRSSSYQGHSCTAGLTEEVVGSLIQPCLESTPTCANYIIQRKRKSDWASTSECLGKCESHGPHTLRGKESQTSSHLERSASM